MSRSTIAGILMTVIAWTGAVGPVQAVSPKTLSRKIDEHGAKARRQIVKIRDRGLADGDAQGALGKLDRLEARLAKNRKRGEKIANGFKESKKKEAYDHMDKTRTEVRAAFAQARDALKAAPAGKPSTAKTTASADDKDDEVDEYDDADAEAEGAEDEEGEDDKE